MSALCLTLGWVMAAILILAVIASQWPVALISLVFMWVFFLFGILFRKEGA
jgi:hypothetical protein